MMGNRVFVVQLQMRWDEVRKELVHKFDLSPASKHGDLVFLLTPTAGPFNSKSIVAELRQKLASYTPNDYLLLIGNPCLIGWTVAIAAHITGGEVKLLQWSGRSNGYIEIKCNLYGMSQDETMS